MKSATVATILAFTAAASARPSLRAAAAAKRDGTCLLNSVTSNPSFGDVESSINQWSSDVDTVNTYLNNVANFINDAATLQAATQAVFISAQDEPCQLSTLSSVSDFQPAGTDAFACAVSDLEVVFGDHVLNNLQTIINSPSDIDSVNAAVGDINFFRCCNVLPDADVLWLDAAADNALVGTVPITANRPNACSSIDCSGVTQCKTKDNGAFGK